MAPVSARRDERHVNGGFRSGSRRAPKNGCMTYPNRSLPRVAAATVALCAAFLAGAAEAGDTTPAQQVARWSAQAGRAPDPAQGRAFFTQRQGGEWSCSSCHGNPPTAAGRHASTGRTLPPLAPAFNPESLTDTAKVDKWLRRNCKDVAGRECSPGEKADVLAWLAGIRP